MAVAHNAAGWISFIGPVFEAFLTGFQPDSAVRLCNTAVTEFLSVRNGDMPCLMRLSVKTGGMVIRRWLQTVLKVVAMAAAKCSGIRVAKGDRLADDDKGHEGGRAIRHTHQDIDLAA